MSDFILKIKLVKHNKEDNSITFVCESDTLPSKEDLEAEKAKYISRFPRSSVSFDYRCRADFESLAQADAKALFRRLLSLSMPDNLLVAGLVTKSDVTYRDGIFTLSCQDGACEILKESKSDIHVKSFAKTAFGKDVEIEINGKNLAEKAQNDDFSTEIVLTEEQIRKMKGTKKTSKTDEPEGHSDGDFKEKYNERKKYMNARKPLTPPAGKEPEKDSDGNIIFKGRAFDASYNDYDSLERCCDQRMQAAYYGRIFMTEIKHVKSEKGEFIIVSLGVTNDKDSVSVQFFIDAADEKYTKEKLKEGDYIKVQGGVTENMYGQDRYYYIKPQNIVLMPTPPQRMDDAPVKRVELHLHTHMSAQDALTVPNKLVEKAVMWDVPALAITDHGNVQAFPEVRKALDDINKSRKKAGKVPSKLKIIYGMEAYITNDTPEVARSREKRKHVSYHCILLVKNLAGLKNLYKLVSKSNLEYFYKHPNIPKFELDQFREGIIVGSACSEGELYRALTEGKSEEEIIEIAKYYDYLEIQPLGNNAYLEGSGFSKKDIIDFNKKIVEIADKLGKMTVATCDVHFLNPEDAIFRSVMQGGLDYDEYDRQPPLFYRTTEEMLGEFEYLGDRAYEIVVENTRIVADMVEDILPIPAEKFPPKIEGSDEELKTSCYEKAHRLYGDPLPKIIEDRLASELEMIFPKGYSVMYIAARKLVLHSAEFGYQVGSRGSVGSSLVAFMSDITEVNALPAHYRCPDCKYSEFPEGNYDCGYDLPDKICPKCGQKLKKEGFNIPFETFLGFKDKSKTPDIDLNFAAVDQARAHKYTEVLFGKEFVYRAGTVSTIKEKTALGFVKHYLESIGKSPNSVPSIERQRLALGFTGVKRTTGQHPGGIMVIPRDKEIYDFTPIQHPAEKVSSDTITTQFDYHFLHENILKLDILGHDGPEMIKMLEDFSGIKSETVPIDDPKMLSLFSSSDALGLDPSKEKIKIDYGTIGVPEFGTNFTMKMLADTKPKSISELVRISGLSHGTDVWNGNAQKLIREGTCTLSEAICCRDDIMTYLISKGLSSPDSFAVMESVRKGKGLTPDWEKNMKEHNVPDWYIRSCKKIQYMFPKAHAVAYVMLSLRVAWFKLYVPLAYYSAFFTLKINDFDAANMIHGSSPAFSAYNKLIGDQGQKNELEEEERELDEAKTGDDELSDEPAEETSEQTEKNRLTVYRSVLEMYQRNIKFLPIDLYKSEGVKFIPEEDGIRPPFASIPGVGASAALAIVEARNTGGDFISIDDLKTRARISKSVIESLASEGCLEGLPESNKLSLFDIMATD
ncbi:MAG: PolC-type DNA polymerase III [Clostridia bacterium]|nr:PolC-type DNA polymerase III [Clostridia bacterium]